jgi:hypothetical protein
VVMSQERKERSHRIGKNSDGWVVVTRYSGTHLLPHIKHGTNLIPAKGALEKAGGGHHR